MVVCKQRDVLVPCSALAWNNRQLGIATNTTCVCTVCCGDLLHSCLSCQPVELTHGTYGACSTAQHNSKQGAGLLGFTRKHSKTHMRRHFVRERKDVGDCEKGWPQSSTRCTQAMRECAPVGLRLSWCMCASRPPSPQETTLLSLSLPLSLTWSALVAVLSRQARITIRSWLTLGTLGALGTYGTHSTANTPSAQHGSVKAHTVDFRPRLSDSLGWPCHILLNSNTTNRLSAAMAFHIPGAPATRRHTKQEDSSRRTFVSAACGESLCA